MDRVPDIRHPQVESLRLAIRTGRFAISPAMIAHRMLAEL
jgi:anti-sigma28 factor (negative regulator of flagellin synthesis)